MTIRIQKISDFKSTINWRAIVSMVMVVSAFIVLQSCEKHEKSVLYEAEWNDKYVRKYFVVGKSYTYINSDDGSSVTVKINLSEQNAIFEMNFMKDGETFRTKTIDTPAEGTARLRFPDCQYGMFLPRYFAKDWVFIRKDSMIFSGQWPQAVVPRRPYKHNRWTSEEYGSILPSLSFTVLARHNAEFVYKSGLKIRAVEFSMEPQPRSDSVPTDVREWWSSDYGLIAFDDIDDNIYMLSMDGDTVSTTTLRRK